MLQNINSSVKIMSELQKELDDLRREAQMERIPVSQSAADLLKLVCCICFLHLSKYLV